MQFPHDPHNPKVGSSNPPFDLNYPEAIFGDFPTHNPPHRIACLARCRM